MYVVAAARGLQRRCRQLSRSAAPVCAGPRQARARDAARTNAPLLIGTARLHVTTTPVGSVALNSSEAFLVLMPDKT